MPNRGNDKSLENSPPRPIRFGKQDDALHQAAEDRGLDFSSFIRFISGDWLVKNGFKIKGKKKT
jgi:hypothetical protein